jgi:DNA gyrase subunit A
MPEENTPPNDDKEEKDSAKEPDSSENAENEVNEEADSETPEDEEEKIQAPDDGAPTREVVEEMQKSYIEYAMSVIVSRALPDVRDGMKPVHRRILFVMHEMGLRAGAKFKKSANVVGEVLGKYHPHGDSSVYDAMVRMAQEFSMRYQLVNGQGNFGSIDGDSAAAYRYTEAKMQKISEDMLADIDKDTVDWRDNYDASRKEPTVLPARLPNLLLNGTTGIAVGMATNIPPHNLGELIDGIFHLIDNPECNIEDLMELIKGPDFPTGGVIYDRRQVLEAYSTGKGSIPCRGVAKIEEGRAGKPIIVITEIPYQVNKANLVIKIADLVKNKKLVGITDIRDESTRDGIRVVIELKKDSYPNKILNQLYKLTELQGNFNVNMIALTDRGLQPHLLSLKQVLEHFVEHRVEVVTRRTEYELRVAKDRAHILEGLKLALDHIDKVISTIRKSKTREDAHAALMKQFKLSDVQAKAILEMRLQALAGLEREKIEDELKEKYKLIKYLESLLASKTKLMGVIKEELAEMKEKYADERRTKVLARRVGEFSAKDTIPNEEMVIMLTTENYVKRVAPVSFRAQKRGGKGVIGLTTKEEDEVSIIRHAKNHDDLMFFTNTGRVFRLPVYEVPQATRQAKGTAIANLIQAQNGEYITAMRVIREEAEEAKQFLFFCTKLGTVKKTLMSDYANVRKSGLIAIKLNSGDELKWVKGTSGESEIVIISHDGKCCRFGEKDVRSMGRSAAGVRGIKLGANDHVVEMDVVKDPNKERLLTVTEKGLGKATLIKEYRMTNRGAGGVKTVNVTAKTGKVVGAKVLQPNMNADLLLISKRGQTIRMNVKDTPTRGRATQGVILMRMKNDSVASVSLLEKMPEAIQEAMEKVSNEVDKLLNGSMKTDSTPATAKPVPAAAHGKVPAKAAKELTPEEAMLKAEKAAEKADLSKLVKAAKKDVKAQKKEGKPTASKKKDDKAGKKSVKFAVRKVGKKKK